MSYQLVTVKSPHMSCPVHHGTWPELDGPDYLSARAAARSLVAKGEVAEIRQGGRVVERIDKSRGSR